MIYLHFRDLRMKLSLSLEGLTLKHPYTLLKIGKKLLSKVHSKHDVDLIFDQKKGFLFWNPNGAGKGYGKKGGMIARLVNVSDVESNDFLFLKSVINKVGDLPSDLVMNPEASQNTLKNNSMSEEFSTKSVSVEVSESSSLSINYTYYGYRGGRYSRLLDENSSSYEIVNLSDV
ncbi:MAG: hypothetical protein ED554_03605 [Synechococcus sp. YX04-3]|nr:MAG: hypothetical protein ED554_03605 [Synechococcus sp. YX04-3]